MDLLSDLNEPQRLAVAHQDGPLLVLAGAGSGKTRVITRRVANLIRQGVAPWQVLAITFTNRASGEMRERVERLEVPKGATICTFHSLCARLLREFALEAGLSGNYTIYDRNDQLRIVKEAMARLDLKTARLSPAAVHAAISNAKNEMKTPQAFAQQAGDFYSRNVAGIYRAYEDSLAGNNALDFDDLLLRTAFLLRDWPDIRRALSQRYRYIMIDEYQDTNHAQYVIAHGIALDHENIAVTGDPDQSIYAWRGADINNILEFEADYPNATVVRLEENYRSTKPILTAASQLIARNRQRKDKALWTQRQGGGDVRVVIVDDEHAEAAMVARRIAKRRQAGGDYAGVAIFYRVNALSRVLEEALLKAGIPYCIARGVEFYNRKEIKDVLAYLRLLVNQEDDLSCRRVINTPTRGIGSTTVDRLEEMASAGGLSLLAACRKPDDEKLAAAAAKRVRAFAELIDALAADLDRPVASLMEDVVTRSGLADSLAGRDEQDRQARANVDELITAATEFDASGEGGGLGDYLHQISLVSDVDRLEGAGGTVTLMTLHAAKGLEFPAVFIGGCEDGLLPFQREGAVEPAGGGGRLGRDMEEERRLAFVGMTRAKDELTLLCARSRMLRGRRQPQAPSRFLQEIGQESVTVEDLTSPAPPSPRSHRSGGGGFYTDTDDRALIEAMENVVEFPPEYEYLQVGCRVRHPKFGAGKVVKLSRPWPETRVEILFDNYGNKKIVLQYTTLELA